MDRAGDRETLKRRAIVALDEARLEMGTDFRRAQEDYSPQALVKRSFEQHRAWWLAGAAVAGFVAVRWLFRPAPRVVNVTAKAEKSSMKSALGGMLFSSLWPLARGPLLDYAKGFLETHLEGRYAHLFPKQNTKTDQPL